MTNSKQRPSVLNEGIVEVLTATVVAISGFLAMLVFAV